MGRRQVAILERRRQVAVLERRRLRPVRQRRQPVHRGLASIFEVGAAGQGKLVARVSAAVGAAGVPLERGKPATLGRASAAGGDHLFLWAAKDQRGAVTAPLGGQRITIPPRVGRRRRRAVCGGRTGVDQRRAHLWRRRRPVRRRGQDLEAVPWILAAGVGRPAGATGVLALHRVPAALGMGQAALHGERTIFAERQLVTGQATADGGEVSAAAHRGPVRGRRYRAVLGRRRVIGRGMRRHRGKITLRRAAVRHGALRVDLC